MEEITNEENLNRFDNGQKREITLNIDNTDFNSACDYAPPKKKMHLMSAVKQTISGDIRNVSNTIGPIKHAVKPGVFEKLSCLDLLSSEFDCTMDVETDYGNINFNERKDFSQCQELNWSYSDSFDLGYVSADLKEPANMSFCSDGKKQNNMPFYNEDKEVDAPFYDEAKKLTDVSFYNEDKEVDVPFYDEAKKLADVPFYDEAKKQVDMPFCDKDKQANVHFYNENARQAVGRYLDSQNTTIQSYNDPYILSDVCSGETHQSIATILSSAFMMSFGIEERVHFESDLKILEPDITAHFDKTLQYGNNSLDQINYKPCCVENETLVFQELFTRKENEIKAAEKIASFIREQEQNAVKKIKTTRKLKNASQEKVAKKKINTKTNLKNKEQIAVKLDVEQTVKKKCKPKTGKVELRINNKIVSMHRFGSKTDTETNGKMKTKEQNMIKMQTVNIHNNKQFAPSEKSMQIHKVGDGKVNILKFSTGFAGEINDLKQENIASEWLKKITFLSKKCKKPKGTQKKQTVSGQENDQKHALEVASKIIKLLIKADKALEDIMCNEKEQMKHFDEFICYIDITPSVIELLPHFVLMIKCVKDCHAFSSKVKNVARKVYFSLQAMYGVQVEDTFESKYIAAVKKKGKVQSRKVQELVNAIRTWKKGVNFDIN